MLSITQQSLPMRQEIKVFLPLVYHDDKRITFDN